VAGEERFGDRLLLDVLALGGGAEHVHVVAAQHRRRVGVLPAGIGVDLRVEHHGLDVGPVLEDDLRRVLIADVAHAAVAPDDPRLWQFQDLLVGHHRVAEVDVLVELARVDDVRVAVHEGISQPFGHN
jgi:hypothetical protein